MRVFALSDIHVDYDVNMQWVRQLSRAEYVDDVLILAGDVSHRPALLSECLETLARRFRQVLFVPGNHDLWVLDDDVHGGDSLLKFAHVHETVAACGASMEPLQLGPWFFMPLLGWYDYSFGEPQAHLKMVWADFRACRWPAHMRPADVAARFDALNPKAVPPAGSCVITFSHFMPRLDLIPSFVPQQHRMLDPVLGSTRLETALRNFKPEIHVYGHSHINRSVLLDGVRYVNNAFGYPQETRISARQLLCVAQG